MVRIITRLDQVKKEQHKKAKPSIDFEIGNISGKVRALIAAEEKEFKAGEKNQSPSKRSTSTPTT
jgi:hypothetical protein